MPDLIVPEKKLTVTFSLEPAFNVISSLQLINLVEQFSGFDEWIYHTATTLSPDRLRQNRLVIDALDPEAYLGKDAWPSFTAWLDDVAARDPAALRDRRMDDLVERAKETLDEEVPTPEQLLADRAAYLSLTERLQHCGGQGECHDSELYQEAYDLLNDPPAMQDLVVTYLRAMWDDVVAAEWERRLPLLQEAIAAFQALDLTGMSCAETVYRVVGRELSSECEKWQEEAGRITFIPSAHFGPYIGRMVRENVVKLVFGARVPEGASTSSPELSRSELLMRLNALADETRLRILELLSGGEDMNSQEIMERLDLSQSAASRHLRQLAATGYLTVERREGAKVFRLNRDRIDDTFGALKESVR
ncbi:MAG: winged helix-turn-helix transcriptional regulator [Anaerolineae bacterium]|nr:winged helix-turn-helix transcriptional regulator [Anaerolineae bacterium]